IQTARCGTTSDWEPARILRRTVASGMSAGAGGGARALRFAGSWYVGGVQIPRSHEVTMSTDTIAPVQAPAPGKINVIKREKHVAAFDQSRIENAIKGAYLDVEGPQASGSARIQQRVLEVANKV